MKKATLTFDPTSTGIPRYTHKPTGRAVVRADWMTDAQWLKAQEDLQRELETQQINQQTPGPLLPIPGKPYREYRDILLAKDHGALGYSPKPEDDPLGYTRYLPADARLLASAYTAFDAAGRSLGIDAATLAESVDVAALIRAARAASVLLDTVINRGHCSTFADITGGAMGGIIEPAAALRAVLATLPRETGAI